MSLGPLTTSFTPPADCTASSALYWVNTASTFYWLHGQPGQSSCFPDNYSPYQNQYYSPGICPAGYTRACESASSGGDNVATTRATCCPEGNYVCAATSSSYSYPWGPTLGCMSVYRVNTETRFTTINGTIKGGETAGAPRSLRAPGTIMAYGVVIRNIATSTGNEVIASSSISVSVSNSGMASETASSMPTTEAPQSNSSGGNGGLSSGAAAGIGIATSFGIMAIGGALLWIFWMRRRKRKQEMTAEHGRGAVATPGAWSSTTWNTTPYPQRPVFQANWAPTELDNEREPKEMSAEPPIPVEKDGKSLGPR